ncbi:MAG: glycosyltransferase [Candidatus Micrarchaeota archaeon]
MKKVLFLVTELQKPVGGLHRFTVEYLQAWSELLKQGKTDLEPVVLSIKDPLVPAGDLKPSKDFSLPGVRVFEALRGGVKCYFLESKLDDKDKWALQKHLWDYYGIPSHAAASWDYYSLLNAFWRNCVAAAQELGGRSGIYCTDCQDWLAFPAGFLIKEKLGTPLLCRFHSGEFGRSMGKPDFDAPPVNIEAAALMEADFIQSVSVTEAKFELYNLLPLKKQIVRRVEKNRRDPGFLFNQSLKTRNYERFMLLESEDLNVVGENAAGIANGIILDDWRKVSRKTIAEGRNEFKRLLPGKKKYSLFVGRTETRKGLGTLIDAFALVKNHGAGLVLISSFQEESKAFYERKIAELGLKGKAVIHNGWVGEKMKKALFCSADAIVLPSLYEPFGLVTLEALAADLACEKNGLTGPAVIVGDTGGMHEIIKNGVNGFKSPMQEELFQLNPDYLAMIMEMVFENEDLRKRISKGGASRVESNYFNWRYIAGKIFSLYGLAEKNSRLKIKTRGEQMDVVEHFGGSAGKVWLALKDSKPMGIRELKTKTKLSGEEVMAGLGWLACERKVYEIADGKTVKYGFTE